MPTKRQAPSAAMQVLESIAGEPLTFGALIRATRQGEGETQETFAARLGVSKAHLSDIENGRKVVSAARAARWAEMLGYSTRQFVQLALQDELRQAGLPFRVEVGAA